MQRRSQGCRETGECRPVRRKLDNDVLNYYAYFEHFETVSVGLAGLRTRCVQYHKTLEEVRSKVHEIVEKMDYRDAIRVECQWRC